MSQEGSVWKDYICIHGREVLVDELQMIAQDDEGLSSPPTDTEIENRLGEIEAVIDRAIYGELVEREELKPANVDPELWELRLWINGKPVRIYHAEPKVFDDLMVGLRAHFKWTGGTQAEIDRRQNVEMSRAVKRYEEGKARDWNRVEADAVLCAPADEC